jgi:hypothetical protein
MKKMFVSIVASSFLLGLPMKASAQFGQIGAMLGVGQTDSAPSYDVDGFVKTADEADVLVRKSSDTLFKALATKDELDAHEDKLRAANTITDPKEKEVALKQASDDQQAKLAKVDFAAANAEAGKKMDAKKKALVSAAAFNFTLGMLKDRELLEVGKSLLASLSSNPLAILKMGKVKDVVSSVSGQMSNIGTIASGLYKMSSVVKVQALPTKSSEKPKPIAD